MLPNLSTLYPHASGFASPFTGQHDTLTMRDLYFMKLKECSPSLLHSCEDRACAKLARIARGDTVHGGAKAMVIAKRLVAMRSNVPAHEIVADVYGASNYSLGRWGAYECPECGCAHLGEDAAYACCSQPDIEPELFDDSVKCCPNCERPNQFGETCLNCQLESDIPPV